MSATTPDLFDGASARASAAAAEAPWLEKLLFDAKCWMTAGDITQTTFGKVLDRDIRQLASESRRIISGQRGYKHVAHATPAEVAHFCDWMERQAKLMGERAGRVRSEAHAIFSKAKTS